MSPIPLLLDALALVGATVHPMTPGGEPFVATVLVEDGRIAAVAPDLELEAGVVRVDAAGKHVVPGLVDGLVSFDPAHDALFVSHGITLVRDMGSDPQLMVQLKSLANRERTPGPALVTAAGLLDGAPPRSPAAFGLRSADEARRIVQGLAQVGADFVHLQPGLVGEPRAAACEAALALDLDVWGQRPAELSLADALGQGQRGLVTLDWFLPLGVQWGFVQPRAFEAGVRAAADADAVVAPILSEVTRRLEAPDESADDFALLAPYYEQQWWTEWESRGPLLDEAFVEEGERIAAKQADLLRRLATEGVALLPGSGAPLNWVMPGRSLVEELEAWVAAGIPAADVLASATRGAAIAVGEGERRGTVEVGKVADLVVLDGDPRESLAVFHAPHAVVVRGRLLDRAALDELVAALRTDVAERRAEDAAPLEIEPPERPQGAVLLAGEAETRYFGSRLSGESWMVVREPDDALRFVGRILFPVQEGIVESTLQIDQKVVAGRLVAFTCRLQAAGMEVNCTGREIAGHWQLERREVLSDGGTRSLGTISIPDPVAAISLGALGDSVTTALVLSQRARRGPLNVWVLGELFEPALLRWELYDNAEGDRLVSTHVGRQLLRLGADGALVGWGRRAGDRLTATTPVSGSAFGGPGLPPVEMRGPTLEEAEAARAAREGAGGGGEGVGG